MSSDDVRDLRPLDVPGRSRQAAPFVATAAFAILSAAVGTPSMRPLLVAGAAALTIVVIVATAVVPWPRLPAWAQAGPALAYFVVIAMMRDATGGSLSGFGPLVVLPVIWLALHGTRPQLLAAVTATAAVFVMPVLVVGSPRYPPSEWRRAALSVMVMLLVGTAVQRLVGERQAALRGMERLALTDALTGVPNRRLLLDRLTSALARARRGTGAVALLFCDLDRFKAVNDALGHEAGDELLRQVAERMRAAVRPSDTVARIGGDEFLVLLTDLDAHAAAVEVADRLRHVLGQPFVMAPGEAVIGVSVGIAYADDGADPEDLLRQADRAMYDAKQEVSIGSPPHAELGD